MTRSTSPAEEPTLLARYRTPEGGQKECTLTLLSDLVAPPPSRLRRRLARQRPGGNTVLLVSVPPDLPPRERAVALDELDSEILAGRRLAEVVRLNGADPYPPELSRLLGHSDDIAEPFALLEAYRGQPVRDLLVSRQLFEEERAEFQHGLLRALAWTEAAEVVHRGVRPRSVRWDAERGQVQLCEFTSATVAGTPRSPVGERPWAPHQQREGVGFCDPRDDLWGAGLVLFQAFTGRAVEREERLPLSEHPAFEESFGALFEADAARRPTAARLLRDLTGAREPARITLAATLEEGRHAFRAQRRRKHPEPEPEPPAPEVEAPDPPARPRWLPAPSPLATALAVVVALVLAALLGGVLLGVLSWWGG